VLDAPEAFEGTAKLFATLSESDERWTFGIDPSHLSDFLARRGLVLDEDVGAVDYRARYFGRAASGMRGYEFYRVAVAHVPERDVDMVRAAQQCIPAAAPRTAAERCVRRDNNRNAS
jgi:hypothetical protein